VLLPEPILALLLLQRIGVTWIVSTPCLHSLFLVVIIEACSNSSRQQVFLDLLLFLLLEEDH
jgi:hypothetical protein